MKTFDLVVKEHIRNVLNLVEVEVVAVLISVTVSKETEDPCVQEHLRLFQIIDLYLAES